MDNTVLIALIAFLSSSFTALFAMLFKLCYASKCKSTSLCCGCLKIERDTNNETPIRNLELNSNIKVPNFLNKNNQNIENIDL